MGSLTAHWLGPALRVNQLRAGEGQPYLKWLGANALWTILLDLPPWPLPLLLPLSLPLAAIPAEQTTKPRLRMATASLPIRQGQPLCQRERPTPVGQDGGRACPPGQPVTKE